MKKPPARFLVCILVLAASVFLGHRIRSAGRDESAGNASGRDYTDLNNSHIDMSAFLQVANEAAAYRQTRRVTEDEFIRMSQETGTIILDARSREKFDLSHIRGAINLSFPDIDIESLKKTLPDKNARILIYCNNNFGGNQRAFPSKQFSASLNLSTYVALYDYGYRNVYELGPYVDVHTTRLPLVGAAAGTSSPVRP